MKKWPKVFIIILNYNGQDCLKRCLTSVFKIDYPNFEVILLDNASEDGSLEMAKKDFSRAIFIRNNINLGFAGGVNVGIRFALEREADYVLLLNYDTLVETNFLTKIIEAGESMPSVGILSSLVMNAYNKEIWFAGGKINWLKMKTEHFLVAKDGKPYEVNFLSGCAMAIKASVFLKIGLFDEDYFLYWEDADFGFRAQKAGFKLVLTPESWVYHFEKSEEQKPRKIYWLVLSGMLFFKKNSTFWSKPYFCLYNYLRRLKNKLKIKKSPEDRILQAVNQAFQDFSDANKK